MLMKQDEVSRRRFFRTVGLASSTAVIASMVGGHRAFAATVAPEDLLDVDATVSTAASVPPLPYEYGALEPFIDEQTMRIHHDRHHAAYVTNLNAALANA